MKKLVSMKDLPLESKKILVRVDFNVPMENGKITDNTRIKAALPTIEYLLSKNCAVILISHLGRPKESFSEELSLKPIAKELQILLKRKVFFAQDCIGPTTQEMKKRLKPGEVLLLENLRFYAAEEKPEKDFLFAKQLADQADYYINDAFGSAHRAHASIVEVPKLLKNKVAPGFLLEKEIKFLGKSLSNPERPFLAIIGGAKISSKIGILKSLASKVDILAIGGGMAYTFLKAEGFSIGNSLVEEEFCREAKEILQLYKNKKIPLLLPIDLVISKEITNTAKAKIVSSSVGIPDGYMGLDIGPKTIQIIKEAIAQSKTILWNGPLGVYEKAPFAQGTEKVAESFAKASAVTIAGGGETAAALLKNPWSNLVSHISTGGGATLEYLENDSLPGIKVLET